jgi:hypothetical protein
MHKNHIENEIKQNLRVYNDLICEKGALLA